MIRVSILGASGYIGGELLRLLLCHPEVAVQQATSDKMAMQHIGVAHPNLRGRCGLKFSPHGELRSCDVLFMAMKHGVSNSTAARWRNSAAVVIDLSADFRLRDRAIFESRYGVKHETPDLLGEFTPGIPEIYGAAIRSAKYIAVPGCTANAAILALWPLSRAGLFRSAVFIDAKSGSSGSGSTAAPATHHPERSGVTRVFKGNGHRHEVEIAQVCGIPARMTATSIEAVRGVLVSGFAELARQVTEKEVRSLFRDAYGGASFVRFVQRNSGAYSLPEPKLLTGTNYCDVGFALANDGRSIACFAALDNLTKGASGNAVQCMNMRMGWNERVSLDFPGLHPL